MPVEELALFLMKTWLSQQNRLEAVKVIYSYGEVLVAFAGFGAVVADRMGIRGTFILTGVARSSPSLIGYHGMLECILGLR